MSRKKNRLSDNYAPYGKCNKCGIEKKDWSFKYQGLCTDCYKEWKNKRAELHRSRKLPNINVELANDIVVTRNVLKRLENQSQTEMPVSRYYSFIQRIQNCIYVLAIVIPILFFWLDFKFLHRAEVAGLFILSIWLFLILISIKLLETISVKEINKRYSIVEERVKKLAAQRKQRMDETKMFYASAEWKLLRKEIIRIYGRKCNNCKILIVNDEGVTVDHVLPRSRFWGLALNKDNLQVLCRSCNSKKKDKI